MKKLFLVSTALALLALSGCQKLVDHIKDHLDDDDKTYRIEKWDRTVTYSGDYTGTQAQFTYNKNNDPTDVIFNTTSTGYNTTHWKFNYDKHKRLSECYMYYDNLYYFKFIRYQYNNKGQIISDSSYEGGSVGSYPDPELFYVSTTAYTYDTKGRISKIVYMEGGVPYSEFSYSYDADGNLIRPGYVYDNKLNFLRTNKVWMFINHDYSVNNAAPAASYNSGHLPITFNIEDVPEDGPAPTFLNRSFFKSTFTYKKIK